MNEEQQTCSMTVFQARKAAATIPVCSFQKSGGWGETMTHHQRQGSHPTLPFCFGRRKILTEVPPLHLIPPSPMDLFLGSMHVFHSSLEKCGIIVCLVKKEIKPRAVHEAKRSLDCSQQSSVENEPWPEARGSGLNSPDKPFLSFWTTSRFRCQEIG